MTKRSNQSKPPEGSLRALAGDQRPWRCPTGTVGRAARKLLDSSPATVAEKLVGGDAALLQGLEHLVGNGVLTPRQCDLILDAVLALPETQRSAVRTLFANASVKRMITTASTATGIAISKLLIKDSGKGGMDVYT
ncbi:MAG: hypothetical protein ABIG34_04525 [Candidatus Peregrinibacteria bacterium]